MITRLFSLIVSMATLLGGCAASEQVTQAQRSDEAAKELRQALEQGDALIAQQKFSAARTIYTRSSEKAQRTLGADSPVSVALKGWVERAGTQSDDNAAVGTLTLGMRQALLDLEFKPIMEAPLPVGFPEPGPVGEVIVNEYPAYRMAKTERAPQGRGSQDRMFSVLFSHIKRNEIAMTAPVEMTYVTQEQGEMDEQAMGFMYQQPTMGAPGSDPKDGRVRIVDVPAMTVVSMAIRGGYRTDVMIEAVAKLENWLSDNAAQYERAGPLRRMGYNSPFIPSGYQYSEVQIPVRRK